MCSENPRLRGDGIMAVKLRVLYMSVPFGLRRRSRRLEASTPRLERRRDSAKALPRPEWIEERRD